ncbi:MAG TPA: DUF1801 domain-containing protein [Burkholderiaceae bacterium]|jgi:hypothetical protein
MRGLFKFPTALKRDPDVERWFDRHSGELGELGALARHWFEALRQCGADVDELLHDGHPTACVNGAAFAYVNAFKAHVNLGFFQGAELADPDGLLEGEGKFMRHVKLKPGAPIDAAALSHLIEAAYVDVRARLKNEA